MMWLLCILFSCMVLFLEAYGIILCSQMCYNDKTKLKTFYIISFQGKKKNANQTVAIKKFMGVTEEYQKREADTLSLACKTNHPNIVKFIGFDKGTLAIEFCGGGSLDTHIGANGLPPSEFERFFNQFINQLKKMNGIPRYMAHWNIYIRIRLDILFSTPMNTSYPKENLRQSMKFGPWQSPFIMLPRVSYHLSHCVEETTQNCCMICWCVKKIIISQPLRQNVVIWFFTRACPKAVH